MPTVSRTTLPASSPLPPLRATTPADMPSKRGRTSATAACSRSPFQPSTGASARTGPPSTSRCGVWRRPTARSRISTASITCRWPRCYCTERRRSSNSISPTRLRGGCSGAMRSTRSTSAPWPARPTTAGCSTAPRASRQDPSARIAWWCRPGIVRRKAWSSPRPRPPDRACACASTGMRSARSRPTAAPSTSSASRSRTPTCWWRRARFTRHA